MKNLDEFKSRKEWEEFIWVNFLEDILKIKSAKELKENLEIVISKKEKQFIIKRLLAVYFISKGKKYREIGDYLWISPSTISAIKKAVLGKINYQARDPLNKFKKIKNNNIKFEYLSDSAWKMIISLSLWMDKRISSIKGKGRWNFLNNL
ncbi:hypothetical protein HZC33_02780 [Candidatus Wolfebacteria bacterium]|nr:hypothetical protein [Candidatus Wolfebacteria bacterium]